MLIEFEPAFILNTKPYKESSLLVDIFTKNFGRVSIVAKGVKRPRNKLNGFIQQFSPSLVSYFGKGTLHTLKSIESHGRAIFLANKTLISGLYINELIIKFCNLGDAHPSLFDNYLQVLLELQKGGEIEIPLRYFEKALLQDIGYKLQLDLDISTKMQLNADEYYEYIIGQGPLMVAFGASNSQYKGSSLIALRDNTLRDKQALLEVKLLMRKVIAHYLDGRIINSRKLLINTAN